MKVLKRKHGEGFVSTGACVVKVLELHAGYVQLGIEAPQSSLIVRHEKVSQELLDLVFMGNLGIQNESEVSDGGNQPG